VFSTRNIHYDVADRTAAISAGGIGGIHLLATRSGLADRIDAYLHLLKIHNPYHESDGMGSDRELVLRVALVNLIS